MSTYLYKEKYERILNKKKGVAALCTSMCGIQPLLHLIRLPCPKGTARNKRLVYSFTITLRVVPSDILRMFRPF